MKATELMVGDWVLMKDKPYKVASLSSIENLELESDKYIFHCLKDEIVPVPLTPEILEQNGFVKQAYDGWLISEDNGRGLIEYRTDYFDGLLRIDYAEEPFSKLTIKVKYLHELQHALILCGIDKEITI